MAQVSPKQYWKELMDEADVFMKAIMHVPVAECMEPMVSIRDACKAAKVEVTFSDLPHIEGLPRLYYLREGLIESFLAVARDMNAIGWILKVEDAYRTIEMQRGLGRQFAIFKRVFDKVVWECDGQKPPVDLLYRRLGAMVALAPKIGTHQSGSAMDVSVIDREAGVEVDRGAPYLEMSELTPMASPLIPEQAQANRRAISDIMFRHGFYAYPYEFWHYSAGDAYEVLLSNNKKPARYGAVSLDQPSGNVTPVPHPKNMLHSEADIKKMIDQLYEENQAE